MMLLRIEEVKEVEERKDGKEVWERANCVLRARVEWRSGFVIKDLAWTSDKRSF
jgi:hypothetical protein